MPPAVVRLLTLPRARARALLELMRVPNLLTAAADVLAGAAVAAIAGVELDLLPLLVLASMFLYAGGVTLNDAFDAPRDARERPERPIPSGRIERQEAFVFGGLLLGTGVFFASLVGPLSAKLALAIAIAALVYDALPKSGSLLGPSVMASCRGLNLLLGMSLAPGVMLTAVPIALLPFAHTFALTAISRGEVRGGTRLAAFAGLAATAAVTACLALASAAWGHWASLLLAGLYAVTLLAAYGGCLVQPTAAHVRAAVKTGVLALILLDAALVAGFWGLPYGLAVLLLLPASVGLARRFPVT